MSESGILLRSCYTSTSISGTEDITQVSKPIAGFVDDYAYMIRGLLDLYEASLDGDWLIWAKDLQVG